ncbi:major facilitator superfamily domain-containing protein [Aspergillus undulatus]|uniref:major facilitator superfamily domain-containing protein n=1 Tax=Aspergillus undulatus TaxID=1810928 RepID=UPI003CCD98A0
MLAPQSPASLRKGTKSCAECRRRKVRCVRIPEDAPTCRQCTERNTACLAQTSSVRPRQAQRLPSRLRIAQLESQVSRLTKVVSNIEVKLGGNPSIQTQTDPIAAHSPGSDDSDAESTPSEILIAEEPSHLRSLFQNDWLSVDTQRHYEQLQERRVKASAHLLERIRPVLQKLIPSKDETASMLVCTYDWLSMIHLILPQPSMPISNQEMLERYDEMHRPDVDVLSLTLWLLTLAITAQQVSQGALTPEAQSSSSRRRVDFAHVVSDTVENLVLAHDRLTGTLQGLGMCIQFIRLQMGRGNPQKAWLKLRHVIALAELMGLPKAAQLARYKKTNSAAEEATQKEKVELWDLICTVDRLSGTLINLPPYTRRYQLKAPKLLIVNGTIQPAVYLSRLMDITPKIYDLEDLSATEGPTTKLYTSALEIAREARELASQLPQSWWAINVSEDLKPDHVVQYVHYCIVMKAHLPVALRQDRTEEYLYSRLAMMDACENLAHRYRFIRSRLPSGFFTLKLLDLQALSAMASLLLLSHTCPSPDLRSFQIDKTRIEGVVTQVIELMEEKSKDGVGSDFAERGASTLRALSKLLQQDASENAPKEQELTVNVPLLGKIHVRRNCPATPSSHTPQLSDVIPPSTSWPSQAQMVYTAFNPQPHTSTYPQDPLQASHGGPMQWEPLSWSVENGGDNLLEDALMIESFDQAAIWQNLIQQQVPLQEPIRNGGFEPWLSVVAVFCVFVNTWGLISTYGAFQEFYQTTLLPDESPSAISWVGSIQATLIVMVGIVSGPLVDTGFLRPLIVSGSFLVVFGMMMTSLATQYYQVILAQGFCVGIGGGIAYIPSLVIISTHFTTKRPIAIGCASIGSSVGSVVFPIMFRQLQPKIGFPWTVRSIAFINLFLAVVTCAVLCRRPGEKVGARSLIDCKAFKDIPFMLFSVSLTLVMLGYWIPLFYVASYARTVLQTSTSLSFYMLSIINGASAFASAIAMFTWITATSVAGFIVWACYWGFLTGVLVTGPTSIISHPALCPDMKMLGTRMGMMWAISSLGSLAGTPIAGTLVDLSEAHFLRAQVFAGCMMVGAVGLQLWPTYIVIRYDRKRGQTQQPQ